MTRATLPSARPDYRPMFAPNLVHDARTAIALQGGPRPGRDRRFAVGVLLITLAAGVLAVCMRGWT